MSRPLCSVVFVTYNRADLLRRSIRTWNRMRFPLDRLEVICVDDGSTDETSDVIGDLDSRIDVKYVRVRKPAGLWRDCAVNLNNGIRIATGERVFLTHPEVLFGRETIAQFCDRVRDWHYCAAKPYYLSARDQERLDTVDWMDRGPLAVRGIDGFYDPTPDGNPDYTPRAIESVGHPGGRHSTWESWVAAGLTRASLKRLGGMIETQEWG